jgi:hypothetical protein
MRADLHTHTTCSDGKSSPLEIIERAQKEGLDVVSITDHDTVRAYSELSPTEKSPPEKSVLGKSMIGNGPLSGDVPTLIPGAEMTAKDEDLSVHLLAYGLDPQNEGVKSLMASQRTRRKQRVERIIDMLAQRGVSLAMDDILFEAGRANLGRPHVAAALIRKNVVQTTQEAFTRYLNPEALEGLAKGYPTSAELIPQLKSLGGVVILAHPGKLYSTQELEQFRAQGIDGLEVIHPSHDYELQKSLGHYADQHHLLKTGGSDYHGDGEQYHAYFGIVTITSDWVSRLQVAIDRRRGRTSWSPA